MSQKYPLFCFLVQIGVWSQSGSKLNWRATRYVKIEVCLITQLSLNKIKRIDGIISVSIFDFRKNQIQEIPYTILWC